MPRYTPFLLLLIVILIGIVTPAMAAIPDPANSTCTLTFIDNDACLDPAIPVWCPFGDMSFFELEVEILDGSSIPCGGLDLRIVIRLAGRASIAGNDMFGCGFDAAGERLYNVTTNALGQATIQFSGGGCGCLEIGYVVEAAPVTVCTGFITTCVKSPDLNGDGTINFFDTFQFLPCLGTGLGYCCDFTCDGAVNFFDVFQYLPHLSGGHSCLGNMLPLGTSCSASCP